MATRAVKRCLKYEAGVLALAWPLYVLSSETLPLTSLMGRREEKATAAGGRAL